MDETINNSLAIYFFTNSEYDFPDEFPFNIYIGEQQVQDQDIDKILEEDDFMQQALAEETLPSFLEDMQNYNCYMITSDAAITQLQLSTKIDTWEMRMVNTFNSVNLNFEKFTGNKLKITCPQGASAFSGIIFIEIEPKSASEDDSEITPEPCCDPELNNKSIEITLFKVSPDGQSLKMLFNLPTDYYADSLQLEVRYLQDDGQIHSQKYDLSNGIFVNTLEDSRPLTVRKTHWEAIIQLNSLPVFYNKIMPAIYIAHVHAKYLYNKDGFPTPFTGKDFYIDTEDGNIIKTNNDHGDGITVYWDDQMTDPVIGYPHYCTINDIEDSMVCSDTTQVYRCLLDSLLMQKDCCEPISDELIRNYLILYGHSAALTEGDFETAETYFKLMQNCFGSCPIGSRPSNKKSNCNCGR